MLQLTKNLKQRGSITLLGALTIFTALSGVYSVIELGNKMIMDRNFDNYAEALAPVALRTQLALTQGMTGKEGKVNIEMARLLSQLGHTMGDDGDITVNIKFGTMEALDSLQKYTDPKTDLVYTLTEEFVPLANNPSNPLKGLNLNLDLKPADRDELPKIGAIAIELVESNPSGLLGFHPKGQAVYGISQADAASTDIADCFCDSRYDSCLVADLSGVPLGGVGPGDFLGDVGTPSKPAIGENEAVPPSDARRNYCEYGYVESQYTGFTKFPSVALSSQWLGKVEADGTPLIVLTDAAQLNSFETVVRQEPLYVKPGINPFKTRTFSFWTFSWFGSSDNYYADWWYDRGMLGGGSTYKEFDVPSDYRSNYSFSGGFSSKAKVDGYFYVGRTGVCVAGTTATDVPNISGGLDDLSTGAKNYNDEEVKRCLSYYKDPLGSTTSTADEPVNCVKTCSGGSTYSFGGCGFMSGETVIETCDYVPVTTSTPYSGYAQQSCRDFNRAPAASMNFFEWMMSMFFGGSTDFTASYVKLGCGIKKMKSFSKFSFPFWR